MAGRKLARLTPQAQTQVLANIIGKVVSQVLPITLQNAQIPLAVVQPYLAKLVPDLAQRIAQGVTVVTARQDMCLCVSENSQMLASIVQNMPQAVAGTMKSATSEAAIPAAPVPQPLPAASVPPAQAAAQTDTPLL